MSYKCECHCEGCIDRPEKCCCAAAVEEWRPIVDAAKAFVGDENNGVNYHLLKARLTLAVKGLICTNTYRLPDETVKCVLPKGHEGGHKDGDGGSW